MDNFLSGCEGGRFLLLPARRGTVCWCRWMPALAAAQRYGAVRKAGKEVLDLKYPIVCVIRCSLSACGFGCRCRSSGSGEPGCAASRGAAVRGGSAGGWLAPAPMGGWASCSWYPED